MPGECESDSSLIFAGFLTKTTWSESRLLRKRDTSERIRYRVQRRHGGQWAIPNGYSKWLFVRQHGLLSHFNQVADVRV